ncbi:hypothetical protein ACFSGI_08830 [Paenibacillus nicotianae]|uniref:HNH endonuclease n=1 Tax=Paenibacillus nicotianae TaxID=1526551 RepID=A0ABW4UR74_9BACL
MNNFRPVPKPKHKRLKPTARERGAVSKEVYATIMEREHECCGRCYSGHNLQAAHLERRWKLQLTTYKDVCILCHDCHYWADNTAEGREWLKAKRDALYAKECK